MVSELSKYEIPLTEDERLKYLSQENKKANRLAMMLTKKFLNVVQERSVFEAIEEIYRLDRPWNSVNTPPTHNNPVLAVVDLARPQDEILRKAWGKPRLRIVRCANEMWFNDLPWTDVLKITHWSELPEMP